MGGGRAIVADLNNDGYPDIVFCNYIHNTPGIRTAYIYWGGPDGYSAKPPDRAAHQLGLRGRGGRPQRRRLSRPGLCQRGRGSGHREPRAGQGTQFLHLLGQRNRLRSRAPHLLPTHGARDVAIADINHDGYPDIAFINNSPWGKSVEVFLGSAQGILRRSATRPLPSRTQPPSAPQT